LPLVYEELRRLASHTFDWSINGRRYDGIAAAISLQPRRRRCGGFSSNRHAERRV
jgi:hypothetical protein